MHSTNKQSPQLPNTRTKKNGYESFRLWEAQFGINFPMNIKAATNDNSKRKSEVGRALDVTAAVIFS